MTARYCTADSCQNPRVPMPPDDNSRACAACWGRLEQQLAMKSSHQPDGSVRMGMRSLVHQLNTTISRQSATGLRNGPRGNEKPLAYDANASEAMEVLHGSLWGWMKEALQEHPDRPYRGSADVLGLSRGILGYIGWLKRRPDGQIAIDEINAAVTNATRAIDVARPYRALGPCLAPTDEGGACPDPLWYKDGDKKATCIRCGTIWDVNERDAGMTDMLSGTLAAVPELILSASRVGLKVTQQQISRWKQAGDLVAHGDSPERFDLDQVLALAGKNPGRGRPRLDKP